MTAYALLNEMVEKKLGNVEIAKDLIFDAYNRNRIDGVEYEELINKALAKYWK